MRPNLSLSRPLAAISLLSIVFPAHALYFYMDPSVPKCFVEELVQGTLVTGHFQTAIWVAGSNTYQVASSPVQMHITFEEIFDNNHRVYNSKHDPNGKFTFTAQDSGEHKLCFTALNAPAQGGWLSGGMPSSGIKFTLDMAQGEADEIKSGDQTELEELVSKVKELNNRLEGIRKEQIHQREREAEFRDLSETTNSRVVRWSLIQLTVLGVTCAWQLSHLRSFFIKQKLT